MKRIAVMSYNIGDIDIITLDKEIRTNKEVEDIFKTLVTIILMKYTGWGLIKETSIF